MGSPLRHIPFRGFPMPGYSGASGSFPAAGIMNNRALYGTVSAMRGGCHPRSGRLLKQFPDNKICFLDELKISSLNKKKIFLKLDICSKKMQTCTNGKCEGAPTGGVCLETQTQCGDLCCHSNEICQNGRCVSDPCPKDDGYFWCAQDQVCCKPGQRCQNGTCINACEPNEVACGADACCKTSNNEICNQGRCVQVNPLCQRKDWLPHYVGQVPTHACTGGDDAECVDECPGTPGEPRSGGGVRYTNSQGEEKCCCNPKEVHSTNGNN